MGQSLHERGNTVLAFPVRPAPEGPPAAADSLSIEAQLVTSVAAGRRLLDAAHDGPSEYIMESPDGQTSVRVRLAVRSSRNGTQTFGDGALLVDWSEGAIEHAGHRVSLLRAELRILGMLLDAEGDTVSRGRLIACAWPHADAGARQNSLAVYICGLRKRLATIGLPGALQTLRRSGYRMRL
jgi:hypothetical protein